MPGPAGSSHPPPSGAQQTTAQRPLKTEREVDELEDGVTTPPLRAVQLAVHTTDLQEDARHERANHHASKDPSKPQRNIDDWLAASRRANDGSNEPRAAASAHQKTRRRTHFFPPSPSSSAISAYVDELGPDSEDDSGTERTTAATNVSSSAASINKDKAREKISEGPCDRCKTLRLECTKSSQNRWSCDACKLKHTTCTRNGERVSSASGPESRPGWKPKSKTPAKASIASTASSNSSQGQQAPESPFPSCRTPHHKVPSSGKTQSERPRPGKSRKEAENSDARPLDSDSSDDIEVVSSRKRNKVAPPSRVLSQQSRTTMPDPSASDSSRSRQQSSKSAPKHPLDVHTTNILKDTAKTLERVSRSLIDAPSLSAFGPTLNLLIEGFQWMPGFSATMESSEETRLTEIYQVLLRVRQDCVPFIARWDETKQKEKAWLAQALVDRCVSHIKTLVSERGSQ
ncbi:hypothetical protein PSEUBRA_000008 [Kalmanozyma brasiliensis GHG001]|uniref:uncharacterized protein n=1 Tax=Kalmanozyma brasiliensis (strain GHG001) TaxID=1365824 RepID=UPI0028680B45|nr:uncharacterized protein PSEUBRA_000008 [Kalmanozyma brasiliensis GHG001]KAF6766761.1 hypothetical protein PSEUBRA_000008 [Kalmanozyma brasiliensis GHG001]